MYCHFLYYDTDAGNIKAQRIGNGQRLYDVTSLTELKADTKGGKERFKYDGVTVDRGINGARNILLRAMRDASATA